MDMSPARAMLEGNLVWDDHGCMPLRPHDESFLPQLARYRAAGINAVNINIGFGDDGIEQHIRMVAQFRRWLSLHSDEYLLVQTVDDLDRARQQKKLAVMFDIEGSNAIADQVSLVQLYYDLGVRWMLMAYNRHNRVGGGCQEDNDPGLTAFGREVLDEMARVGMVACCSHTGYRTALDVLNYSSRPVIFSHSNPRAVYDHPRNVTDEMLKGCAATGGVVGLNGIGLFLTAGDDLVEAFIRHLDYVVQLIGAQHVGVGLDYVFDLSELDDLTTSDPTVFPPELGYGAGMKMIAPEAMEDIVTRLMGMGYSDTDLKAILGGNFLRVAKAVWRAPMTLA